MPDAIDAKDTDVASVQSALADSIVVSLGLLSIHVLAPVVRQTSVCGVRQQGHTHLGTLALACGGHAQADELYKKKRASTSIAQSVKFSRQQRNQKLVGYPKWRRPRAKKASANVFPACTFAAIATMLFHESDGALLSNAAMSDEASLDAINWGAHKRRSTLKFRNQPLGCGSSQQMVERCAHSCSMPDVGSFPRLLRMYSSYDRTRQGPPLPMLPPRSLSRHQYLHKGRANATIVPRRTLIGVQSKPLSSQYHGNRSWLNDELGPQPTLNLMLNKRSCSDCQWEYANATAATTSNGRW